MDATSERFSAAVDLVICITPLTERVVASVIDVSQSALNRKINGVSPWRLGEVHKIAILFGIPPGVLIDNDPAKWRRRIQPRKIIERSILMGGGSTCGNVQA